MLSSRRAASAANADPTVVRHAPTKSVALSIRRFIVRLLLRLREEAHPERPQLLHSAILAPPGQKRQGPFSSPVVDLRLTTKAPHSQGDRPMLDKSSRREFLVVTSAIAAATAFQSQAVAAKGANDKLVVGLIGCGGRGVHDAGLFKNTPNVEVAYVCDVDEAPPAGGRQDAGRRVQPGRRRPAADSRRQVGRRGDRRHARPLALAGRDPGLRRRQARLRREADLAQHSRGPAAGRGRRSATRRSCSTARRAAARAMMIEAVEAAARRDHRRRAGGQVLEHPAPRLDRPRARHRSARRASTTTTGSARRR